MEAIKKVLLGNPQKYQFRNPADIEKVISALAEKFSMIGQSIVYKSNNGKVSEADFEALIFATAQPFLKVRMKTSYVPRFSDPRSAADKKKHSEEVGGLIDFFVDKLGYVFIGEFLGDETNKNLVKAAIAENYLFEGDVKNEIVLRRNVNGMLSIPFPVQRVIEHYSKGLIDSARTTEKQNDITFETEKNLLEKFRVRSRSELSANQKQVFDEQLEQAGRVVAYSKRKLPPAEGRLLELEYRARSIFKLGLESESHASLSQRRVIDVESRERLEGLNSLPEVQLQGKRDFTEPWSGLTSMDNTKGTSISSDMV